MQQLDKNMSSLRSWLVHIESELTKPIIYDSCDFQEIQRKLDLQQVTVHMYVYITVHKCGIYCPSATVALAAGACIAEINLMWIVVMCFNCIF